MMRLILLLGALACGFPTAPGADLADGGSVLFVGNSLTYWNDMPLMVQALADATDPGKVGVRVVAFPDFNLEDHLARGDAMDAIRRGGWTTVVLQQGPSTLPSNRAQLRASTSAFATEISRVGARTALYSVWPTENRQQDFASAHESYALAASDVNGVFLPVGAAWLAAWRRDESTALYSGDGLHPSVDGSYLAALVIAARLTGRSPIGMPRTLTLLTGARIVIAASRADLLQQAAAEALESLSAAPQRRLPRQPVKR
jgi:hypothetical protein